MTCCGLVCAQWEGVLEKLYLGLSSGLEKAASVQVPVREAIPGPRAATDRPLSAAQVAKAAAPAARSGSNGVFKAPGTGAGAGAGSSPAAAPAPARAPVGAGAPTRSAPVTSAPVLSPVPRGTVLRKSGQPGTGMKPAAAPSTAGSRAPVSANTGASKSP